MDQQKEIYRQAQELLDGWSSPYRDVARSSEDGANAFARLVIQALLLTHGGALLALPPLWNLVQTQERLLLSQTISLIGFAVGLGSAIMSAAFGFHCLSARADSSVQRTRELHDRAWAYVWQMQANSAQNVDQVRRCQQEAQNFMSAASQEACEAGRLEKRYIVLRNAGTWCAYTSMFAFTVGAVSAFIAVVPLELLTP
jgi:hypothetical protein